MAIKKRTGAARQRDLRIVAQLYLQRLTQAEIAKRLGVSQQQVSYDIKTLHVEWQKARQADVDQRIAEELERLNLAEREFWLAWQTSQTPREERTTERDAKNKTTKTTVRMVGQAGDPRFVDGIVSIVQERLRIVGGYPTKGASAGGLGGGLTAPIKSVTVTLTTTDGNAVDLDLQGDAGEQ